MTYFDPVLPSRVSGKTHITPLWLSLSFVYTTLHEMTLVPAWMRDNGIRSSRNKWTQTVEFTRRKFTATDIRSVFSLDSLRRRVDESSFAGDRTRIPYYDPSYFRRTPQICYSDRSGNICKTLCTERLPESSSDHCLILYSPVPHTSRHPCPHGTSAVRLYSEQPCTADHIIPFPLTCSQFGEEMRSPNTYRRKVRRWSPSVY
jgi:hypothetical protein